jgi:hypothetical protein
MELVYEECTVLELKTPLGELPCAVKHSKKIVGTAAVLPAELTDGSPALLLEGIDALIELEGVECPLPLANRIKGDMCLKLESNETVKPKVVTSQAIQKECKERTALEGPTEGPGVKDKITYGTQEAFMDGQAELFLGGATHTSLSIGVSLQ